MYGYDAALVDAVLEDHETAPVRPELRALLGLLKKQTLTPDALDEDDIDRVRAAGVSDEAIVDAMYIAFVFNVIVRLADAFDYPLSTPADQRLTARALHHLGYAASVVPGA